MMTRQQLTVFLFGTCLTLLAISDIAINLDNQKRIDRNFNAQTQRWELFKKENPDIAVPALPNEAVDK